jgi:hypothetical protein
MNYKQEPQEWKIPPITAIGFNVWADQKEFMFRNILITTNESAVKEWNGEDFVIRQRKQIRAMKINYQWIDADVPDDVPKPGVVGRVAYWGRCTKRTWNKVPNKPLVIVITLTVILIMIPIIVFCSELCSDPFAKLKTD